MKTETTKELMAAEAVELETEKAYHAAKTKVRDLKLEILFKKFNVRHGSIVKVKDETFRVTFIEINYFPEKPWVKGFKQKKDGNFRDQSQHLFTEWEVIEA